MKILHIANYYIGAKVYKNLVSAIDRLQINQTIYTAFLNPGLTGANAPDLQMKDSEIVYRPILNTYTRLNYNYKIRKITGDIQKHTEMQQIDCIHAHTLFSDGRIAYNLFKKYNKPYLVTIRNTDINFFFKYFLHLRKQAKETLLSSKKIVFISEAYKKRLLAHPYFKDCKVQLEQKSIVIPNGIDDYWINNTTLKRLSLSPPAKLIFVGKISKGKNIIRLMETVLKIKVEKPGVTLHIAGTGKGKYFDKCMQKVQKHPTVFVYHGNINDKLLLRNLYCSSNIFVMPSKKETFGLVYVEALSQGLPVLYTKNEGIDGFFPPNIGEAANSNDEAEIKNAILKIINQYDEYNFDSQNIVAPFNWKLIAEKYSSIYKSAIL